MEVVVEVAGHTDQEEPEEWCDDDVGPPVRSDREHPCHQHHQDWYFNDDAPEEEHRVGDFPPVVDPVERVCEELRLHDLVEIAEDEIEEDEEPECGEKRLLLQSVDALVLTRRKVLCCRVHGVTPSSLLGSFDATPGADATSTASLPTVCPLSIRS